MHLPLSQHAWPLGKTPHTEERETVEGRTLPPTNSERLRQNNLYSFLGAKGSLTKTEEQRLTSVGTGKPQHGVIPTIFLCLVIQEGRRGRVQGARMSHPPPASGEERGGPRCPKQWEKRGSVDAFR